MSRRSTSTQSPSRRPPRAPLRGLEAAFERCSWPSPKDFADARARARARARAQRADGGASEERALRVAAAELLAAAAALVPANEVARAVADAQELLGDGAVELAGEALRAPELLALAPITAVRSALTALLALTGAQGVSMWRRDAAGRIECACHVGELQPGRAARSHAATVLDAQPSPRSRRYLAAPVGGPPQPLAALVAAVPAARRGPARLLLGEVSPLLAAVLERDALLSHNAEAQRSLVESSERKLTRLGFDLHDGPIQDVAVLADDVRLLGGQLEQAIDSAKVRELVRGRVEDVEAQLVAIDGELRRLSNEVKAATVLLSRSFETALHERVRVFAARTGIEPRLKLSGTLSLVSTSQQIALLNIVHESLSNIREHSGASNVDIAVSAHPSGVSAEIRDDGCGFDLESALMRAARDGRTGLLAIHERVRLLGGRCRVDSAPGGPTVVAVKLDVWRPLAQETGAGESAVRA